MPTHSGDIRIDGQSVTLDTVQDAIGHGIAYVPEDRLTEGLFLTQSITRNIVATSLDRLSSKGVIDMKAVEQETTDTIQSMQIATPSADKMVGELSGGNAQRVVLGRWLLTDAKVLILNGPTVGVDVGSKAEIHKKIRELVKGSWFDGFDDFRRCSGNWRRIAAGSFSCIADNLSNSLKVMASRKMSSAEKLKSFT